jgi:hypothetical protein
MATTPKVLDLSKHYQSADTIAEGQWFELESGLEVLVARTNSPEFQRVATSMFRKYGGKRGKDLAPEKAQGMVNATMARAVFKAFRSPDGLPVELDGKVIKDDVPTREFMLETLPDMKSEIDGIADLDAAEFAEWIDEAGKV